MGTYKKMCTTPIYGGSIFLFTAMVLLAQVAPFLLFSLVAAEVHRLKLHKIPRENRNPLLEAAYLAEKYGDAQSPLFGSGGLGRNIVAGEPIDGKYVTSGGHTVPLTSESPIDW